MIDIEVVINYHVNMARISKVIDTAVREELETQALADVLCS